MSKSNKKKEIKEEPTIAKGFDRDIEYNKMKKTLIKEYDKQFSIYEHIKQIDEERLMKRNVLVNKLIYLTIAMIQLRNGSRISEACEAIRLFIKNENINEKVIVKIAKSKSIKYKKDTKEKYETKARYRKMMFPIQWINNDLIKMIKENKDYILFIKASRLRKRVLDFLLRNFNCNTHSLRYSFINYMLYDKKKEMSLIAKFVGHVDVSQLVRYTQMKNMDQIFDMDI